MKSVPLFYLRVSMAETESAHAESPVIFTTVLPISKILSTPRTNAIPSTGSPTACNTIAIITTPAPGTPAVPIYATVAVTITVAICGIVKFIP